MTGEEKRLRTKRCCLSRNKRSKINNEQTGNSAGEYPADRSSECSAAEICGTVSPPAGSELNQGVLSYLKDVFEFNDDDDDDDSDASRRSNSNKRKRSDSEEIEAPFINSVKPKFKRACKAVKSTKASEVLQGKYKDDPLANNETETCIESLPGNKENVATENILSEGQSASSAVLDVITCSYSNATEQEPQTKIVIDSKLAGNADAQSVCEVEFQSLDNTNQLHDRGDNSKDHVCPVCGLVFLRTEAMDSVNKHINSCLDQTSASTSVSRRTEERFDPHIEGTSEVGNSSAKEVFGDDLFFCQLCQKDLSKMNSQRRQQHINRCCDQSVKTKENETPTTIQPHTVNQLQCPICSKSFKSSKSRQTHIKKCAQQFGIGTNQLLEIIHQEQQSGTVTVGSVEQITRGRSNDVPNEKRMGGVKRKKNTTLAQRDLDEDTQLALALSASMAPQHAPVDKRSVKSRGKRKKNGNQFPALLLRNDEEAQTVVAMRAAQVLCVPENANDDEISCTPALAPSRLADRTEQQFATAAAESSRLKDKSCDSQEDSENDGSSDAQERETGGLKEPSLYAVTVDPALSKSFLCSLYSSEIANEAFKPKELGVTPLWSLAADKHQPSEKFYVPGLLPAEPPRREQKACQQKQPSTSSAQSESDTLELNKENQSEGREDVVCGKIKEDSLLHEAKASSINELEITPSQAVNVDMLLELADYDDIHQVSMETQPMSAGFCVALEKQEEDRDAVVCGKSKLLLDLSSMVNNAFLSDVAIVLKHGHKLMAHRFMLCLRSEVLAQMLIDQGGVEDIGGQACLKFEDVDQSVFEFVLRHIYTGDVTVPEGCELESVTALAERLKLPCLLRACTEEQPVQDAGDGEEDDEMEEFNTTDLDKLQQELWNDGNEDELDNEWDLEKDHDGIDEFLNDDDIEEILIFQTQLPKKEEAEQTKNVGEKSSKQIGLLNERKDLTEKDVVMEEWYSLSDTDKQEDDLHTGKPIVYSGDEGDKSFNDDLVLEEEQLPLNDGENGKKEGFSQLSCVENASRVSEETRESSHGKCEANDQQLLRDNENNDAVLLQDSIAETVCIECPESLIDSENQNTRFKDQVKEIRCSYEREGKNISSSALATGDDFLTAKRTVEIVDEEEDKIESFHGRETTFSTEIETGLLVVGKNSEVDELNGCSVDQGQVLQTVWSQEQIGKESVEVGGLAEEGTCWDEEVEESSAEEAEINESITLISDNDDDDGAVAEVSPQPTGICVVPETPRVPTNPQKNVSTTSSLTSPNEDDVCITDLSRGKSREQLNAEASQFLSKLKQRIDRGKNKKGGTSRKKQSLTQPKTFARESHYSNTKPVIERQQNSGRNSLFLSQMHTSVCHGRSPDIVSPISLKDCYATEIVTVEKSPSLSPVLDRVQGFTPWLDDPPDTESRNSSSPTADICGREDEERRVSMAEELSDVEVIEKCADNPTDSVYGDISTSSSPRDAMSPPVPSPNYSFFDSGLSPEAFVNHDTPEIAHLSDTRTPPKAPNSSMTERQTTLRSRQQSNSPVSPSVCSFRSPVTAKAAAEKRGASAARNLMEKSFNEYGVERIGGEIDPEMSLRERLNAARCRMRKNNTEASITGCRYEGEKKLEGEKDSPFLASSQDLGETSASQENAGGNLSMDVDLEFYDDGGFNFDMEELNNGEVCYPEDIQEEQKGARYSQSEENVSESHHQEMKLKPTVRGKKIHPGSSRVQTVHENRTKTTSVPNHGAERQTAREPVTPMPQYDDMSTPVLKCELRKFGVRALPKKKMVLMLKEIYGYTHQVDSDSQEIGSEHASDVCRPLSSDDAVSDPVDGMQGNGTASSENSDEEDTEFGECTILIENEAITASQQVNGGNLKEKLLSYIRNNEELYRNLLHFKAVELVSLHQQIKSHGINCPLGKLVDFLDEQCITFTTAGSRSRAPRRPGRKKTVKNKS